MKKPRVRLEDWQFTTRPFQPNTLCLTGIPTGHPRLEYGKRLWTSQLTCFNLKNMTARSTSGTFYVLGKPALIAEEEVAKTRYSAACEKWAAKRALVVGETGVFKAVQP